MALHPQFPKSPYDILNPERRWFPADEALREKGSDKLLPPLVCELRKRVRDWRNSGYVGASHTTQTLLRWWFLTDHPTETSTGEMYLFRYYFAQREALETVVYLYEVAKAKDKYDLLRFDSSGLVSAGMFDETWLRLVIKMATGSGKTKVLSLLLAWCFFHKTYEEESLLARNFLVIAPNIIVLDRLRADFDGLKIFFQDPILPDGYEGQNWRDDFQMALHIQDDIGVVRKTGNIFLTNIHRVYESAEQDASATDEDAREYFLGHKPVTKTNQSLVDLGEIVRTIDELVILNDEAHHIHDPKLAWFKSIADIHNRLKMKGDFLSLQIDVTATPKHNNGAIFVQTVCDYPLVEAIHQDVVKHPVLPDSASLAKLQEHQSSDYADRYKDYLHLGYLEWKQVYDLHEKQGKKAVLFVMTDDTKNCDVVAAYLERTYPELKDAVLVIHTKDNGEISESTSGKSEEELKRLRDAANSIDSVESPYKAIVSVLMLKEGRDVRNVTTIVGLRAYSSKSNILPEQTLGRGLRRMYRDPSFSESVSVVGTDAFMDFVESIKIEGVELERKPMGPGSAPKAPLLIEVDRENTKKDLETLDIQIPILTPRIYREYKNLSELDVSSFTNKRVPYKEFSEAEKREIVFRDIASEEITHRTELDTGFVPDYQSVIGYFCQVINKDLRLVGGYNVLYGKVKEFIRESLFDRVIALDDMNALRNLSELEVTRMIVETFRQEINALTVRDRGTTEIRSYIKVGQCRPFLVQDHSYLVPKKSLFNRIVGDSHFELQFASFLEDCDDIVSYVKNYFAVHFKIDYRNASGEISDYYPDFIVKLSDTEVYIVETKGREDLDDIEKIKRLRQWCTDVNAAQKDITYEMLYVKQDAWEKLERNPRDFIEAVTIFGEE